MHNNDSSNTMVEAVSSLPTLDAHTHLISGELSARGLHDILLYHMAVSDLYAAGCPAGTRLTQYPGRQDVSEAHSRIAEAVPYLKHVRNTSTFWAVKIILKHLYGWDQPITEDNWRYLDSMVRERAEDPTWPREVMHKANIRRFVTELARRREGLDDDVLQYSLEWAFFTRTQWGEFDTALYELERCWGRAPESPAPIRLVNRPHPERTIRSIEDVHHALAWYVRQIPVARVLSIATHISTDICYRHVTDSEMAEALASRDTAGPRERDIYASYINNAFLSELEKHCANQIVFQFSLGAEPLPFETASRLNQSTIAYLADMIAAHPKLRFQCFLAAAHANQSLCTLARELPNFSLAGYWWHNFFPSIISRIFAERLDMLPANKQIGFFSDAYCVEWAYAKLKLVKCQIAKVLADRVQSGQFSTEEAVGIAREILFDTPQLLLGMEPAL